MKAIIFLCMIIGFQSSLSHKKHNNIVVSEDDMANGVIKCKKGDTVELVFGCNPSTGYLWRLNNKLESVNHVTLSGNIYVPEANYWNRRGSGGYTHFLLRVEEEVAFELEFVLKRGDGDVLETKKIRISTTGEDLSFLR